MSTETLQFRLNLIQAQVKWLEREITFLRQEIAGNTSSPSSARTFSQLRGLWAGITFDESDIQASRLKLPTGL